MRDIKVYINGTEADVFDGLADELSINYSISNVKSVSNRTSSYTQTLKLPATATNKAIFGFAEDVNSLSAFSNANNITGRIEADGITVIEGKVKMQKPVLDFYNNVEEYNINIFSGIADWKPLLSALNVRDLDFSTYDHAYTLANQQLSETTTGAAGTLEDRFIVYPLIDYGDFLGQGSQRHVTVKDMKPAFNVYEMLHKMFNNQGWKITSTFVETDYFKALYIPFNREKLLVSATDATDEQFRVQLSANESYTNCGSCTFPVATYMDQAAAPPNDIGNEGLIIFRQRIHWNDASTAGFYNTNDTDVTLGTATTWNQSFILANSQIRPLGGNGYYTVPQDSKQSFTAKVEGTVTLTYDNSSSKFLPASTYEIPETEEIELTLYIAVNGGRIASKILTLSARAETPGAFPPTGASTAFSLDFSTTISSDEIILSANDVVDVRAEIVAKNYVYDWPQSAGYPSRYYETPSGDEIAPIWVDTLQTSLTLNSGSYFYNEYNGEAQVEDTIDVNEALPDINQLEYVKGLIHAFNLYCYTNPDTKEVFIEPRDDFYSGTTQDWTSKLDLSQPISLEYLGDTYNEEVNLRYKDDSNDWGVDQYEEKQGEDFILARHTVDIESNFAREGSSDNTNPVFAPTLMQAPQHNLLWNSTKIPTIWREFDADEGQAPEFETRTAPRLLYYAGVTSIATVDSFWYQTAFGATDVDDYLATDPNQVIAWSRTDYPYMYSVDEDTLNSNSLYYNTTDKSHGLFDRYHRNTWRIINEGRLITCNINLDPVDIAGFDFREPVLIYINGEAVYCTVEAINGYKPASDRTTTVQLLTKIESQPLTPVANTTNTEPTTISVKIDTVSSKQLQTILDGAVVDVYTQLKGGVEPVYEK